MTTDQTPNGESTLSHLHGTGSPGRQAKDGVAENLSCGKAKSTHLDRIIS